jgi:hypothetical protein
LLAGGKEPLFAGLTGWVAGEAGERRGLEVRVLPQDGGASVVLGDLREDLRICGDATTLLEPRALDPATLVFHGATMQRLSPARRDGAVALEATPLHGPAPLPLARLLRADGASSGEASALTDGDPATAWTEARPGRGQGEFVLLSAPFDVPIERLVVTVAPSTPPAPRPSGAAPETFYLATPDATFAVTLPEDAWSHPGAPYAVAFPSPLRTSCLALVLGSAFTRGLAHPDVTVAELTAYSGFDHPGATLADVAAALAGAGPTGQAAAGLLERAGAPGVQAASAAFAGLGPEGRGLATHVAMSAASCSVSGPILAHALADADAVVRAKAQHKLEEPGCGREALPALLAALKEPALRASVAPVAALVGRGRAFGSLVEALGAANGPGEPHVLRSAVSFAARGVAADELARALDAAAARPPASRVDLLRALGDRLAEVAHASATYVGPVLAAGLPLESRYPLVEELDPLAAAGDDGARALLRGLTARDPDWEVRARAAEGLARALDPASASVVASALADPEPRVRSAAVRAVAAGRLSSLGPTLARLLANDGWSFVRVAAAEALASLPSGADADRSLADALDQLSPRVREQAVAALAAHRATPYAAKVAARVKDVKEDAAVRVAATRALGPLCDAKDLDLLTRLAVAGASSPSADEVTMGLAATDALGALHPRDLAARFAPLAAAGVRPDARAAAAAALAAPPSCPLP